MFGDRARRKIGDCADETDPSESEQGQAQQFDARPHQRVSTAQVEHAREVLEVLGGLFDAHDVVVVAAQPGDGLGGDVDRCADRHVVEHDRHVGEGRATVEYHWYRPS